jgi:hypothetical protein
MTDGTAAVVESENRWVDERVGLRGGGSGCVITSGPLDRVRRFVGDSSASKIVAFRFGAMESP